MITQEKLSIALESIRAKIKALAPEKLKTLEDSLRTLEPREIVAYQELKSIAQIEGKISLDVSLWIYNTINHYCTTDLADKVLLTQIVALFVGRS